MVGLGLPVATAPPAVPQARASIAVTTTADVVNPGDGVMSLREAFSAADATPGVADTIELAPGATYVLSGCGGPGQDDYNVDGDLDLNDATGQLTIFGNGGTIQQSCVHSDERVIDIYSAKLVLYDLTITGGDVANTESTGGGGIRAGGDLELDGVTITGNRAGSVPNEGDPHFQNAGAGFWVHGDLEATDSTISDNVAMGTFPAPAAGGGAYVLGDALLDRTVVHGNSATTYAGGLWVVGDLTAITSTISENHAGGDGAMRVDADVTLIDTDVLDNTAGIGIILAGTITATDSSVGHNTSDSGAVLEAETISFTDSSVTGNAADSAMHTTDAAPLVNSLVLIDSVVSGNSSTGATIDVEGSAFLEHATIHDNTTTGTGPAGAGIDAAGNLNLMRSTVSSNATDTTHPDGFAGLRSGGPITIDESTVAFNVASATLHAGVWAASKISVTSSTVNGNEASSSNSSRAGLVSDSDVEVSVSTIVANAGGRAGVIGDGVSLFQTTVAVNAAIQASVTANALESTASIVGNIGLTPTCEVPPGETRSFGFNISAGNGCAFLRPSDRVATAEDPVDLGPLADNGGLTLTMRPLSMPIRIPTTRFMCAGEDQRGVARPVGFACEPGAVEVDMGPPPVTFSDVPVSHVFFAEVDCLVTMGATEGFVDGTFRPTDNITRQAVVAWLWRLAGSPTLINPLIFSDVPASHPFATAIAWASAEGIVQGFPDGTFRPEARVTRQAVAAWLWRQADSPVFPGGAPFLDVPATHPFADAIRWLEDAGITTGFADGTFRPGNNITRMGLAAWVCRDPLL